MNEFIICKECKGKGFIGRPGITLYGSKYCKKCLGFGKLDWIEQIFGKKNDKIKVHYKDGTTDIIKL